MGATTSESTPPFNGDTDPADTLPPDPELPSFDEEGSDLDEEGSDPEGGSEPPPVLKAEAPVLTGRTKVRKPEPTPKAAGGSTRNLGGLVRTKAVIKVDGKRVRPGTVLEMTHDQVRHFLPEGVIEMVD